MEHSLHIGQIIRERRTALDLTQVTLAYQSGCASITIPPRLTNAQFLFSSFIVHHFLTPLRPAVGHSLEAIGSTPPPPVAPLAYAKTTAVVMR